MKLKVIACRVFEPYIRNIRKDIDVVFLSIAQHDRPHHLGQLIQQEIENTTGVDAILVLYGLCGGALLEVHARHIPIYVVRVHDCFALMLGSMEKYHSLTDANPSTCWTCYSLEESGHRNDVLSQWYEKYDEETVAYLRGILMRDTDMYITMHLPQEEKYMDAGFEIVEGSDVMLREILELKSDRLLKLQGHQRLKQSVKDDQIVEVKE